MPWDLNALFFLIITLLCAFLAVFVCAQSSNEIPPETCLIPCLDRAYHAEWHLTCRRSHEEVYDCKISASEAPASLTTAEHVALTRLAISFCEHLISDRLFWLLFNMKGKDEADTSSGC